MDFLIIITGFAFLLLGGEGLVRGCVTIAERLKLSTILISTIIIGFGTSTPELLVSVDAALKNHPQIALGNVIGSNISNTLLVLGCAAIISAVPCKSKSIRRDTLVTLIASGLLAILSFTGFIHRTVGLLMVLALLSYLFYIILYEKKQHKKLKKQIHDEMAVKTKSLWLATVIVLISFILLISGAHLLVTGAVSLATQYGLSKAVIGLTLVALGTSLPEIATACAAAWHNEPDIVISNVLGSNLFNILSIVGITALIKPIPFSGQLANQDVWVMLATSALLLGIVTLHKKISRTTGTVLLSLYAAYIIWLFVSM